MSRRTLLPVPSLLATLLVASSLVLGLIGSAYAKPSAGPPKELKAITAMDSKRSTVRHEPDRSTTAGKAKVATNVPALEAAASPGTPTQNMGNPADKTILQSDVASIATSTDGEGAGNATTQQAAALNPAMTASDPSRTTATVNETARAVIDHQYPSEGGRFVNGQAEAALSFRETIAGSDALWQLGTVNETAEQYGMAAPTTNAAAGLTYVLTQGTAAATNTSVTESVALGTQVASQTLGSAPTSAQQWTLIDVAGDAFFRVMSRADGLCLNAPGSNGNQNTVTVDACDAANTIWGIVPDDIGSNDFYVYPTGGDDQLGSTNGQGTPGPLSAEEGQTWQFAAGPGAERVGADRVVPAHRRRHHGQHRGLLRHVGRGPGRRHRRRRSLPR